MTDTKKYTYDYPRPSVTTDCIIFGFDGIKLNVLLIERGIEPFRGKWAFPGGFMNMDETADECAQRELFEETGIKNVYIEQLYTFTDVNRDPRGRVISVAYFALVKQSDITICAGDDASKAQWFSVDSVPSLAFDHEHIFRTALNRLRGKIRYQPIGFELLDEKFTFPQLQSLYEAVLGVTFDRRNFKKKFMKTDLLIELDEKDEHASRKPAKMLKFDKQKYEQLSARGFNFEV